MSESICLMKDSSQFDTFRRLRTIVISFEHFSSRSCAPLQIIYIFVGSNRIERPHSRILFRSHSCRNPIRRAQFDFFANRKTTIRIVVSVAVCCRCSSTYLLFILHAILFYRFRCEIHFARFTFQPPCHCIFNFPLERVLPACILRAYINSVIWPRFFLAALLSNDENLFKSSSVLAGSQISILVYIRERRCSHTMEKEMSAGSLTCKRCTLLTYSLRIFFLSWFFSSKQQDTMHFFPIHRLREPVEDATLETKMKILLC